MKIFCIRTTLIKIKYGLNPAISSVMLMRVLYGCVLGMILLIRVGYGQTNQNSVTGKTLDGVTGQALPTVTVTVIQKNAALEKLLTGVQTTLDGTFTIGSLPKGDLLVRFSFVGYELVEKPVHFETTGQQIRLETISLQPQTRQLEEVKITAEKSDVVITPEKRIFNVAKSLTSLGGTAESLLRNVPSLNVDESGAASLRNMPATIYVNGKPTQLTLAQIPANQIESVEVIANPSARYEAAATGGIVNLVLKQNRKRGYNGLVSVGAGTNSRYDATVNLDFRKGKWNLTGLYSLNSTKNPLNGYVNRTNRATDGTPTGYTPTGYFRQTTRSSLNNLFQSGRVAIDYTADAHNTFSVASTLVGGAFNTVSNQSYSYLDASQTPTGYGSRLTVPENNYTNLGFEFDWRHTFARKGEQLRLTGSFTRNRVSNAGNWQITAFILEPAVTAGQMQEGYPILNRIDGQIVGNQRLMQLDYVRPVSETAKWEFGLRSFTYVRDQQYLFYQSTVEQPVFTLLQDYSQNARISETVNGAYALYSRQWTPKIGIQAGLRVEQSSLHGLSRFDNTTFGYDYPSKTGQNLFQSLFPSLAVHKKVNETSEWNLSLSRKVGRPNFRHVFVGIQANDRQNLTIGNPKVRPEFVNTAELSYQKSWQSASLGELQYQSAGYYIYEDHTIKPVVQPLATDSTVLVTTFQNIKADIRYGLDNTLTYTVGHVSILANVNAFNVILQSDQFVNQMLGYQAKLNVTYRFGAGISAQVSGQRRSKGPSLQGYQSAVTAADFALRKSFWQNRASVVFTINDIANSRRFVSVYDQPTVYQTSMSRREIRFYKITLQLPLGKSEGGKTKERKVDRPDIDFSN